MRPGRAGEGGVPIEKSYGSSSNTRPDNSNNKKRATTTACRENTTGDEATSIRASHLACRINFILYLEGRPCVCVVSVCARLVCVFVLALLSIFSRQGKGRVGKGAPCNGRINLNCIICCAAKEKKLSQWPKQNKYKYRLEQDRDKKRERA